MEDIENIELAYLNLKDYQNAITYLDDFSSMNNENNKRGFHANINFDELMFIVNGSVNVKLIDKSLNIIEKTISKNGYENRGQSR